MKKSKSQFILGAFLASFLSYPLSAGDQTAGSGDDGNSGSGADGTDVTIIPIPYLNMDQGRQIINIGPMEIVAAKPLVKALPGKSDPVAIIAKPIIDADFSKSIIFDQTMKNDGIELINHDSHDRYKVVDHRDFIAGLGIAVNVGVVGGAAGSPFGVGGAALPIFGRSVTAERFVASHHDAKKLPKPYIPKKAKEVDKWAIGDSLSYKTKGGIYLVAGAQYAATGVFVPLQLEGDWGVFLQKISETEYIYSIKRLALINASILFGNILFGKAGPNIMKQIQKTYSFKLDLSEKKARKQFRRLMRGRLARAQKLANDPEVTYIQNFKKMRHVTRSIGLRARYGFPIVLQRSWGIKKSAEKISEFSYETQNKKYIYEHSYDKYGQLKHLRNILKKKNRHHKFRHSARHKMAIGRITEGSPESMMGEITWTYSNDVARKRNLSRSLKRLKHFTGLGDKLHVKWNGDKYMGFLALQFKLPIDKAALEFLYEKLSDPRELKALQESSDTLLANYFASKDDPSHLCRFKRFRKACVARFKSRTHRGVHHLSKELKTLFAKDHSPKETAKIVSNISRYMSYSPFVLQSVMKLSSFHFIAKYRLNGEKFRPVDRTIVL